jgi:hypothetical protein
VHLLSLPITGMIEFKGTGRDPIAGSVSEFNFNQKLARFGMDAHPENPTEGLALALSALRLGLVIADVSLLAQSNENGSRSWTVPSFEPVDILSPEDAPPLIEAGASPAKGDDLPF